MGTKEDSRFREPTWWDVKVYCLEVGKAHNGYVVVTMSPNVAERTGKSFSLTVGFWPRGRGASEGYLVGVSEMWPHIDYKTMPAMLMNMIFQLDWKLTENETKAGQRALF